MGGGQGNESGQGDESDEGEARVKGRKEGFGPQGFQREDSRWPEKIGLDQEQGREDRVQEIPRCGEEVIRPYQGLDGSMSEGPRGFEDQGVLCHQEGQPAVHQGKGALQEVKDYFGVRATSITLLSLVRGLAWFC